jgi:hypothetical protein
MQCTDCPEQSRVWSEQSPVSSPSKLITAGRLAEFETVKMVSDGIDDWEIDYKLLKFSQKVASGSFGDL